MLQSTRGTTWERKICIGTLGLLACAVLGAGPAGAALLAPTTLDTTAPVATLDPQVANLPAALEAFPPLAEEALALRAATLKTGRQILERERQGLPLRGDDLALLNEGMTLHLQLRARLLTVAEARAAWLELDTAEQLRAGITPELRRQGVALSLAAALILYDNYLLAISLFEGDAKLRRLLNEGDPAYAIHRAEFDKVTRHYNARYHREQVRAAIRYYGAEHVRLLEDAADNPALDYLITLIDQSPSFSMAQRSSSLYLVSRRIGFFGAATGDVLVGLERSGVTLLSMVFGNAVGLVETRQGKLQNNADLLAALHRELQAGDILLEKTPFRLTDKLIPGYWGHAAVWVGSEAELRVLGIWDDPLLRPYQESIRNGRQIVEALRSGVELNPIEQFMNIDSLGVIRRPTANHAARGRVVLQALRQVGKAYDFNFDVESKERVYCSKLVYLAYGDLNWPTKSSLGRTTFTPDDVASRALDGGELQLVNFYHDGRQVTEAPTARMAQLMKAKVAAVP